MLALSFESMSRISGGRECDINAEQAKALEICEDICFWGSMLPPVGTLIFGPSAIGIWIIHKVCDNF